MAETTTDLRPIIERPAIPRVYGVSKAKEYVDWEHVEERLTRDRVYWVVTSGPGGRPHVRPVDGLYVERVIYVGGSPETRWIRDLAANRHVAVHLDGVDDVVIIEGEAEVLNGLEPDLAKRVAAESNRKFPGYGVTPETYAGPGPIAIRPRKIIAWTDFMNNPTRFRFPETG